MNWEEISNQILEINEQIKQFSRKQIKLLQLAHIIQERQQILERKEDIRRKNNAIIENKIKVSPIQTLLLMKFNELFLSYDMNEVYKNIPESLVECSEFLNHLREKYYLGEKIVDMVEAIEKLSEIEYSTELPFEETEYAKLVILKDNILGDILKQEFISTSFINKLLLESMINTKMNIINEYLHNLSLEQKKELFLQSIELSYDKNEFCFFQKYKTIQNICKSMVIPSSLENIYDLFHQLVGNKLFAHYNNQTIEELLNSFDIDLENILKQELKMKKKV